MLRRNSDEEIREAERLAAAGDLAAEDRLWRLRERRGDPDAVMTNWINRRLATVTRRRSVRPLSSRHVREMLSLMLDRQALWAWTTGLVRRWRLAASGPGLRSVLQVVPIAFAVRDGDSVVLGIGAADFARAMRTVLSGRSVSPAAAWDKLKTVFGAPDQDLWSDQDLLWNTAVSRGSTAENVAERVGRGAHFPRDVTLYQALTAIRWSVVPWAREAAPDRAAFPVEVVRGFVESRLPSELGTRELELLWRLARSSVSMAPPASRSSVYGRETRYWRALREARRSLVRQALEWRGVPYAEREETTGYGYGDDDCGDPHAALRREVAYHVHAFLQIFTGRDWLP